MIFTKMVQYNKISIEMLFDKSRYTTINQTMINILQTHVNFEKTKSEMLFMRVGKEMYIFFDETGSQSIICRLFKLSKCFHIFDYFILLAPSISLPLLNLLIWPIIYPAWQNFIVLSRHNARANCKYKKWGFGSVHIFSVKKCDDDCGLDLLVKKSNFFKPFTV